MLKTDLVGRLENPIVVDITSCLLRKGKSKGICGIYKITSPKGKVYVGLSVNIERRFASYNKFKCENQTLLINSFKKHGILNHIFEIIHVCDENELNELEIFYGNIYKVTDRKYGLNIKECGGSSGRLPEESLKKISNSTKGAKNHFYGKKHTEESKKKISDKAIGRTNPMKGKKHTPETKEKISKAHTGKYIGENNPFYGKKHTQETKEKIRQERIGKSSPLKGTKQSDENKSKISKTLKKYFESEENRLKVSNSMKLYHKNKKENGKDNRKEK